MDHEMDHERTDRDTSEPTGTTRRRLLGAATGGFALAASGLFLPEWPEEAAARGGALDGDKGGRHGQDHRGRDKRKRRDHGEKKDKGQRDHGEQKDKGNDRPPQSGNENIRTVALFVHNLRSTAVSVRQWRWVESGSTGAWEGYLTEAESWWREIAAKPATGPEHFIDFVTNERVATVELSPGVLITATNRVLGFPGCKIVRGQMYTHTFNKNQPDQVYLNQIEIDQVLLDQGFSEWETATARGFQVQRLNDTATRKQFLVNLV